MALCARTLLSPDARARVKQHLGLGGGNVWSVARKLSLVSDLPAVVADRPLIDAAGVDRAEFSLAELDDLCGAWSAWYVDLGVRPRDRVAVYIEDSFDDHLQLAALAQIGAIPVMINGRMQPDLALGLMERTTPVGIYADERHLALLDGRQRALTGLCWSYTRQDAGVLAGRQLPDRARYAHSDDDPVYICHSSGTTGKPKPVVWTHRQSLAGVRFRLGTHPEPTDSIMLNAVPQSHSSAIAFTWYALLAGLPLVSLSDQSAVGTARAAATYRPTTILAFNQTFAELANSELDPADFTSVADWMNVGDSAHDAHVRRLIQLGHRIVDGERVPGSVFGDGLGSSELGWAVLRRVTTPDDPARPRYLGRRVTIAEVAVLRPDGSETAPDEVGMLGVRSDSLAPAYWNDSDTYYRSLLRGHWLSGDLVYRDDSDDFYHVDRVVDVIHTPQGDGYSILMEEILLLALPETADCAVVAGRHGGATVPVAVVRIRGEARTDSVPDPADLLRRANEMLVKAGQPELALLDIAESDAGIPVGATGKVLKRQMRETYATVRLPSDPGNSTDAARLATPLSANAAGSRGASSTRMT